MIQIYFLSIILNLLAGLALSADFMGEKISGFDKLKEFIEQQSPVNIILGISVCVIGLLKLASPISPGFFFIGDLIPGLAAIFSGATLLFLYFKNKSDVTSKLVDTLENILIRNKSIIGVTTFASAILHFLLPGVTLIWLKEFLLLVLHKKMTNIS